MKRRKTKRVARDQTIEQQRAAQRNWLLLRIAGARTVMSAVEDHLYKHVTPLTDPAFKIIEEQFKHLEKRIKEGR